MQGHVAKPSLSAVVAQLFRRERLERWVFLVTCAVFIERALAPWKRVLEGVKEVPEHPGNDGVVEEAYAERRNHGCYSYEEKNSSD